LSEQQIVDGRYLILENLKVKNDVFVFTCKDLFDNREVVIKAVPSSNMVKLGEFMLEVKNNERVIELAG
jgi:hypothetical protein